MFKEFHTNWSHYVFAIKDGGMGWLKEIDGLPFISGFRMWGGSLYQVRTREVYRLLVFFIADFRGFVMILYCSSWGSVMVFTLMSVVIVLLPECGYFCFLQTLDIHNNILFFLRLIETLLNSTWSYSNLRLFLEAQWWYSQ